MRRRMAFSSLFLALLSLFSWNNAHARIGLDLTVWAVKDGNAFRNYEAVSDQILQPGLSLYYSHETETFRFRTTYSGSWTGFNVYNQRQFFLHDAGLSGQWMPTQTRLTVYWGGDFGVRRNESAYEYYDYRHGTAYLNFRVDEGDAAATLFGISLKNRRYSALPQFDFNEWTGSLRQHVYLPTRTTVIVTAVVGQKRFTQSINAGDTTAQQVIAITDPENTRGNSGKGKGSSNSSGKGKKTQAVEEDVAAVYTSLSGQKVSQLILSLRLAQSVTPKTGIAAEISQKQFLKGEGRYLSYQDGGYEDEDILFDDPYNYSGKNWSVELTQILPLAIRLKLGWDSEHKQYVYPAFDFDGNPVDDANRNDRMQSVWMQMTRSFSSINSELFFSFRTIQNESNDPYFDYEGGVTSLGWQIRF